MLHAGVVCIAIYFCLMNFNRFAARSKTFSVDMCPKLLEMITGQATSLPIKLRLIPIFQHMHHDAATAAQVRLRNCVK